MTKPLLELIDVHRTYQIGESTVQALRGVSVSIEQGDFVAIMGPSGSGKSSLMQILGLLDTPDKGDYLLHGKNVNTLVKMSLQEYATMLPDLFFSSFTCSSA